MVTLTFNLILEKAGINPKDVYLVRHQDTRVSKSFLRARQSSPYALWMNRREQFECYQQLQSKDCFGKRTIIASFVGTPWKETLFIGLYVKRGVGELPDGMHECPVSGKSVSNENHRYYHLDHDERLSEMEGKLTIEWGNAFLSWVQRADVVDDKKIVEIRKKEQEEQFPGYREFRRDVADIESVPIGWQQQLRQSKGIYLLTCKDHGKQYVGKADGEEGFLGRFRNYAANGHGGNEGMKKHKTSGYMVTILDSISTPAQGELEKLEELWKIKLGSREWGLNEN
jgi:hypothetical protein